ncbi:MAG: hypothetical protein ABIN24_06190 [Dyadobacter sp.]
MKTQQFIESGILESYLLGMSTDEEQHQVNQMVMTHSEISEYLVRFEKNIQGYFLQSAVPPPADVREIVQFRSNKTDVTKKGNHTYYDMPKDNTVKKDNYLDIEVNDTYIKVHKWWRPAFVAVFILSKVFLITGLYYYFKAASQEDEIQKLRTEIASPKR